MYMYNIYNIWIYIVYIDIYYTYTLDKIIILHTFIHIYMHNIYLRKLNRTESINRQDTIQVAPVVQTIRMEQVK